jgi:parallel beta-helix repeat protein
MARTTTAKAQMASLLGDNTSGAIGADDVRTVLTSAFNLIENSPGFLNVKDFGAIGDGTADDTVAIQAALNQGAWKTIYFPAGLYRTTAPLTGPAPADAVRLLGEGGGNTTIRLHGNGTVLALTDAKFCSIEELTFQHGSGTGSGVIFWGINGSNNVDRCYFSINAGGHGLAFSGTDAVSQSSNRVTRCLFLENGLAQLYMHRSNDGVIAFNAYGGGTGPYSPAGCHLSHSSAGQYMSNEHWNNVNGLRIENSSFLRISNNRFEEARNEGVLATNSPWCQFTGNYLHTNSQSSSGTYSALRLGACNNWNITGNMFMSWNTLRHKHSIEADATCSAINMVGNMMDHSNGTDINTSTAANVTSTGNV